MRCHDVVQEIRRRKLDLAGIDPRGGMPIIPPAGASANAIAAVEARLSRKLPPSYRSFLEIHDGWPQFYQGASLLGTRHLSRGTYEDVTQLVLEDWVDSPKVVAHAGCAIEPRWSGRRPLADRLVPFGIDERAETIFAWNGGQGAGVDGELEIIVWINEIGERVETFLRFLELVLELVTAEVDERRRRISEVRLSLGPDAQRLAASA